MDSAMKRLFVTILIGSLLLVGSAMAAKVTNVGLSYQNGATVARIDIEGQVRFMHSTEIPKNGKPHRVIVDILSATHELGAKEFQKLPACFVTGVRSSQFAVSPEKVVRVVFDVKDSPIYRVESDSKSITLYMTDMKASPFETWSTAAVLAASPVKPKAKHASRTTEVKSSKSFADASNLVKSSARKNQGIESDRMASLAAEPEVATKPSAKAAPAPKQVAKAEPSELAVAPPKSTRATAPKKTAAPKTADTDPQPTAVIKVTGNSSGKAGTPDAKVSTTKTDSSPVSTPKPAAEKKTIEPGKAASKVKSDKPLVPSPVPSGKSKKEFAGKKAAVSTRPPSVKAAEKPASPDKGKAAPAVAQAVKPVAKGAKVDAKTPPSKASSGAAAVKGQQGQKSLAQKVKADQKNPKATASKTKTKEAVATTDSQSKSTSRFRRSQAATAKIKGTMVAEFPKRLVIKYKSSNYRDPFRPLINEEKMYNTPIDQRVPNVEGLRLVGIIESDDAGNRALFEDNVGYSYMLKSGDKVRNGYVLRVESDRVFFQIFEYGWSRTLALKMEEY
jgi:phage repressor protein C with HTH and peptisase S24 domain